MKILNIRLKNFLCYSGEENEIKFSDGLNLILGANGYGKSKLYDAFNWLFFDGITNQKGERIYSPKLKSNLISRKALGEVPHGKIECKVTIELIAKREEFLIERKYEVHKKDGKIIEDDKSSVQVFIKDNFEYLPYDLPIEYGFIDFVSEKIISTNILPHIWFQGERGITKAVDTSNGKSLLQVINKISYIDMWQRYVEIADSATKRVRNTFDKEARKSKRKQEDREKLQSEIDGLNKTLKKNIKELSTLRGELDKVNRKIGSISIAEEAQTNLNNLKREEDQLTREYKSVNEKLSQMIDQSDRNIFDQYWVIHGTQHSSNHFDKLFGKYIYERQREFQEVEDNLPKIPRGNPKATHLNQMIQDCHCHVCDRAAPKGSEAYESIKRLLPENYPAPIPKGKKYIHENDFYALSRVQIGLQLNIKSFKGDSETLSDKYFKLDQKRVELKEKIESIKDKIALVLADVGIDNIDSGIQIGKNYKNLNEQSSRLNNKIGRLENQILEDDSQKKDLDAKLLNLLKLSGEIDESILKQMQFFNSLSVATKDAKEFVFNQLVNLLEKETNRHYENINIGSGAFYGEIKFDKNTNEGYTANVYNSDGENVTNNMNTSQILSMQLSILFAILSTNKQKGLNKKYPLIADAPNSSFDPEKRKFLLREMGETFDQSIVMMFEYLEKDDKRENRYRINQKELNLLKQEMAKSDVKLNVVHLDIPDKIDPKKLQELSIDIKQV